MKFVKSNILPIVCGLVVLLSVVALFYPIGKNEKLLRKKMRESLSKVSLAESLSSNSVHIPGEPVYTGPIVPAVINAKRRAQMHLAAQVRGIDKLYAALNARGRVVFISRTRVVPLLGDHRLGSHILPHIPRNLVVRGNFRSAYLGLFAMRGANSYSWLTQLQAGTPPSQRVIQRQVKARLRAIEASLPQGAAGSGASTGQERSLVAQITKKLVYETALHCRVYANRSCFQMRSDLASGQPLPHSTQVYEGVVDSWLQQDVVNAINLLDRNSANVAHSPVKRLIHIYIGSAAAGEMISAGSAMPNVPEAVGEGGLFLSANHSTASSGSSAPSPAFGAGYGPAAYIPPNMPRPPMYPGMMPPNMNPEAAVSTAQAGPETPLTHITSNPHYQVTLMAVSVDVVPSDLNAFIDALYRQNIGYTVLKVNIHTVDPIHALTSGYVFGKVPVVRADILLQAIFLSSWNKKIMPSHYKRELGLTAAQNTQNN